MATTNPSDSDDKKSMDVSKPGKSAPSSSARPVIVSHKPLVQDPMVKPEEAPEESDAPLLRSTSKSKVIQPPSDATKSSDADNKLETPKSDETAEEAAIVDAVAEQAKGKKKTAPASEAELNEEEQKRQEGLQKLVDSKRYFVKLGQVTRRRRSRNAVIALILVILLGGFGFLLLIDAGLIKPGFNAPFDLVKEKQVEESPITTPTVAQPAASKPIEQEPAVPKGLKEYKNEELGFAFVYPEEWGSVEVEKTEIPADSGSGNKVVVSFADNKDMLLGLLSRDYTFTLGRDGDCYLDLGITSVPKDFTVLHNNYDEEGLKAISVYHKKTDKLLLSEGFEYYDENSRGMGACPGLFFNGIVKFADEAPYPAIELFWHKNLDNPYPSLTDYTAYRNDKTTQLSDQKRQQIIDFIESIKEL